MTNANLIPYLTALEPIAVFIVTASIQTLLLERGLTGLIVPSTEQKTYKQWAEILELLTPDEILRISDIVTLLRDPEAVKHIYSTTNISGIVYLLNKPEVIAESSAEAKSAKIISLLDDPKIRKELTTLKGYAGVPGLVSDIIRPTGLYGEPGWPGGPDLISDIKKTMSYAKGIVKLNTLLFTKAPRLKTLGELEAERKAQIATYNKTMEERFKLTEKEKTAVFKEEKKEEIPRPPVKIKPSIKKDLIVERIPYPKWWKDSLNSKISLTAPGSSVLATVSGRLRLFVATIVITVTGETELTFHFGDAGSSGPIYLGGTNQPMGMVVAMGNSPAPCGRGNLSMSATDPGDENPKITGWATCFVEVVGENK